MHTTALHTCLPGCTTTGNNINYKLHYNPQQDIPPLTQSQYLVTNSLDRIFSVIYKSGHLIILCCKECPQHHCVQTKHETIPGSGLSCDHITSHQLQHTAGIFGFMSVCQFSLLNAWENMRIICWLVLMFDWPSLNILFESFSVSGPPRPT